MGTDCGWAIDFHANSQRGDRLLLIELARAPAEWGIVRAADDLPPAIAIRGRKHDVSPVPAHLGLAIADAHNSASSCIWKNNSTSCRQVHRKATFDGDISSRMVETEQYGGG
jgi:hypothetical protein